MRFKKLTITTSLIIGIFSAGELYLHIQKPSLVEPDQELGWKLKSNFNRVYAQTTQEGESYSAHFETNQYGFRTYGDNSENALKILVLGDSFTADAFSSNDQAWFSVLGKNIESSKKNSTTKSVTVWAGGAGGYGTLQELIQAKRIKKHFKADILILQFCVNDFTDNSMEIEKKTFLRQLKLRRPYLSLDEMVHFNQGVQAQIYRSNILQNSRIFNKLDSMINGLEYIIYAGYSRPNTNIEQERKNSFDITRKLLVYFHKEFQDIPNIIINCSSSPINPDIEWLDLVRGVGFIPITAPSDEINRQLKAGRDLLHSDGGHWNPEGNKLVGEVLYDHMNKLGYFNRPAIRKNTTQ